MNTSTLDGRPDAIAHGGAGPLRPNAATPQPRRWGRMLLLAALVLITVLLLATAAAVQLLAEAVGGLQELVHVTIDGRAWTLPPLDEGSALVIAIVVVAVVLGLLVLLPLALLLGGALVLLGMVLAAVAAFAPVLLLAALGWLLWRLLRRRPQAAPSTTIKA